MEVPSVPLNGVVHRHCRGGQPGASHQVCQRAWNRARGGIILVNLAVAFSLRQLFLLRSTDSAPAGTQQTRRPSRSYERGARRIGTIEWGTLVSSWIAGPRGYLVVCALALVAVTGTYANHFRNEFHFDDVHT